MVPLTPTCKWLISPGLQAREQALVATLSTADDPPPLPGPNMDALFAEAVRDLRATLKPRDGAPDVALKGNLAAMFTAAVPADWDRHMALVAGARNPLDWNVPATAG